MRRGDREAWMASGASALAKGVQRLGSCSGSRPLVSGVRTTQRLGEQCSAPLALDIFFPPRGFCFGQQLQRAPAVGSILRNGQFFLGGGVLPAGWSAPDGGSGGNDWSWSNQSSWPNWGPDRGMFEIWCVRPSGPSGGDGSGGGRSKAKRGMAAGCAAALQQPRLSNR